MGVSTRNLILSLGLLVAVAGVAGAVIHDRSGASPLAAKEFMAPQLEATPVNTRLTDLPQSLTGGAQAELQRLGADASTAQLDSRGGRWRTLLMARPMIPGDGVGNQLTWAGIGTQTPMDDAAIGDAAWRQLRSYLEQNAASLRIDVKELSERVVVHDAGEVVQVWADRISGGLPVRGVGLNAGFNSGNLVLLGAEGWGDIQVDRTPSIPATSALETVRRFVAPMNIDGLRAPTTLELLPTRVDGFDAVGGGYQHRLAWVVRPIIPRDIGQWEALVDAHSGELLAFQDLNHYGTARTITGGVYPVSYDGIAPDGNMVQNYPMPFADIGGGNFTDSGGNFTGAGPVTTTLTGEFIRIDEFCGSISETSGGDIDMGGTDGDVDCDAAGSAGNTAAARSGFYELNRIKELAMAQLPTNTWLQGVLEAEMNISPFCNAFWTGSVVQFFSEAFPCGNTGQLAGVFDHEWGHGMDDNDVNGSIPGSSQGGGEGMADIYAALRLNQSCVGRGFFIDGRVCNGYGDSSCTTASGCTGIRTVDWAERTRNLPQTLTWVQANCGTTVHCLGAAYSETVWDILKRDLPSNYGMDNNTALEAITRLTFIGAGNASGWFDRTGSPGSAGCAATQAYTQFLLADDDDGNILNGTPHMTAIAAAFDRHEIGCTPANGGPTVQDSGCLITPDTAPVLSAVDTVQGADLSWFTPVETSQPYNVYRTDGEHGCDFGKTWVGQSFGTTFSDSGLLDGRPYYYVVIPMGPGPSCFGPASNCASVGSTDIFADGFESGDTSVWSTEVP